MSERPGIARVLPDTRLPQLDREFDYRVPPGMSVAAGIRVKVPLGRGGRVATGYVTEVVNSSGFDGNLADIEQVVSDVCVLPASLLALAREVANRHAGGVSDVLRFAIPARAVRVEKAWLHTHPDHRELPATPNESTHFSSEAVSRLESPQVRAWWQLPHGVADEDNVPSVPLGHSEIARHAVSVLSSGRSVVISAPDWRDITYLTQSLSALTDDDFVVTFDQDDTASVRYRKYLRCLEPRPVIVVGARHAIYAPVHNLGSIVVYNDSDDSHREPLAPYPHTRDVALIRAEQEEAGLLFASLSPSIHIVRLIHMGFLEQVHPQRHTRPRVIPTSLTTVESHSVRSARLPSIAYQAAKKALQDSPVLVQVFRAGFAPGVACDGCGERARCRSCQGPLRSARASGQLSCSWCGHAAGGWSCTECGHRSWRPLGQAVGRTVSELGKAFPGVSVVQADGEHRHVRLPRERSLVVATRGAEPVVPGGYPVALLLDGQSMLQRESLGALTDALQAWESALGLLAPDGTAYLTDLVGPVAQAFSSGGVNALLERELAQRHQLQLPPAVRLAVIEGPPLTVDEVLRELHATLGEFERIGPIGLDSGLVRFLLKVPYSMAPQVARELRAHVVHHATTARRGSGRLKVSMDGQHALDELTAGAQ